MTDLNNEINLFSKALILGRLDEALTRLKEYPALADTNTQAGRDNFTGVIKADNYALTKAFLAAGADVNALDYEVYPAVALAVDGERNESLRAILEYNPDLASTGASGDTPLERAFTGNTATVPGKRAAARQLIRAGALEAPDESGYSPLTRALATRNMHYVEFLVENGVDMSAIRKNGMFVFAGHDNPLWKERYGVNAAALGGLIEDAQKQWKAGNALPPETWLKRFSSTTNVLNEGLPHQRLTPNRSEAWLEKLYMLLSADAARPLTSAEYWSKHGGATKGLEFIEALRRIIPDHLGYMRERFHYTELLREDNTPREGSVTVSYARGGGVEAGRV